MPRGGKGNAHTIQSFAGHTRNFGMPYAQIDLLIANEDEAAALAGGLYPTEEMLGRLHKICPNTVILTMGQRGSYTILDGQIFHQEIFPVNAVDSTGAGDTYAGYVAACLARGDGLQGSHADGRRGIGACRYAAWRRVVHSLGARGCGVSHTAGTGGRHAEHRTANK